MKKRIFALLLTMALLVTSASALSVEQARELLKEYYIDEIPEDTLAQSTIEDILKKLGDPYTVYYTAEERNAFTGALEDTKLVGIGIVAYYLQEGIQIVKTAPDSPARKAGLQPDDYIIDVDGHDVCGASTEDIDRWLKGEEGTSVRLRVRRGDEVFQVTVVRVPVVFPNTELVKLENGVGWISCSAFGTTTCQHFYDIITEYDDQVEQWVVDLRGNGGGDVYAAVFSAGLFAGTTSSVYMRDGAGNYYRYKYDTQAMLSSGYCTGDEAAFYPNGYLTQDPVYVLTDESSASASELFCAAVRDSGAGLVIGGRTYGKGVAQTMFVGERFGLQNGEALKITTERVFGATGGTYDRVGIIPHIMVDPELADEVAAILAAPYEADEDILVLRDVSAASALVDDLGLPMSLLCAPENAAAAAQLLAQLPPTVSYQLRKDGVLTDLTAEQAALACGVSPAQKAFSDTADNAYSEEIETLAVYGIIHGMGDGTYQPEAELNRASLCALLVKALRFPVYASAYGSFADVGVDDWYAPYVYAMYEAGLVNGYDGYFHPEDPITHEQFLTILGRVAQWLDMDYYELAQPDGAYGNVKPDAQALEADYGNFAEWAREQVWICDEELLWTSLDEIDPAAPTARGEAAAAVYNLLWQAGILQS